MQSDNIEQDTPTTSNFQQLTPIQTEFQSINALNKTLENTLSALSTVSNNLSTLQENLQHSRKLANIYTDIHSVNRELNASAILEVKDMGSVDGLDDKIVSLNKEVEQLKAQLQQFSKS